MNRGGMVVIVRINCLCCNIGFVREVVYGEAIHVL